MLAVMTAALEVEVAADLLWRARQGISELTGTLDGNTMVVVDLDTQGDVSSLELFPTFPGVVVGIGDSAVRPGPLRGVDVALTGAADPPSPWVGVVDLDAGVDRLTEAAEQSPLAAVTLAQVLRGTGRGELGHDLVTESLAYSTLQAGPEFGAWLASRGPCRPRPPEREPAVLVERSADRLDITLNRPLVRNAYNAVMRDQLSEALSLAAADPSVVDVHIHGDGPDFCSGGDLDEFGTSEDRASAHLIRTARSSARLLGAIGDRAVAHLHGACVGAGIELPALAARVVAAPDTRMQLPEVAMGLIPGAGGTASLPRRIGRHRTAWMALSGQVVDAVTGFGWGLVDEIDG